ncbi:Type IX secretion system membrane protein PorP/SprF [anaerobic digester metagenome]
MKTIIKTLGFVCAVAFIFSADIARGQQEGLYTQYMFNTLIFNPAYAGTQDLFVASLHARTQWTGFKDAPETQTLLVHSPLNVPNMGTGLSIVNDITGPLTQRNIMAYYSYGIKLSKNGYFNFGMSAGIYTLTANLPKLELSDNEYDPSFADKYDNATKFNVGFGMFYHSPKWYCGISAPKLYNSEFLGDKDREDIVLKRHYYLLGGVKFRLSEDIDLKPSVMVRKVSGAPVGIDLSALVEVKEKIWAGLAGRWEEGASIIVGGMVTENIRLGYSYDATFSSLAKVSSGSHEVLFSYEFPVKASHNPLLK